MPDRPVHLPDYHLEYLGGEILLYHLSQTRILYCNQTASLIWQLCDGERTTSEITTLLAEAYPEAQEALAEQVQLTLEEFLRHGAIRYV